MLQEIAREPPYTALEERGRLLETLLTSEIERLGLAGRLCVNRIGSLLTLFFAPGPMTDFASVQRSDTRRYAAFFHAMRERGIFLPPAQFEAWFLSTAHSPADIRRTAKAAGQSLDRAFAA
jgi:glutamate-1-semialdehyde 2,1-aminomutase